MMHKPLIIVALLFAATGPVNTNDPIDTFFLKHPKIAGTFSIVIAGALTYTSLTTDLETKQHIANAALTMFYTNGAYLFFSESKKRE